MVGLFLLLAVDLNFQAQKCTDFGLKSVSLRRFLEIQEYA